MRTAKDAAGVAKAYIEYGHAQNEIATHLRVRYSTTNRRLLQDEKGRAVTRDARYRDPALSLVHRTAWDAALVGRLSQAPLGEEPSHEP